MKIKNVEERIKRIWNKSWWAKVIGVVLIFFLWPFIVGWLLIRLVFRKFRNNRERWILAFAILLFFIPFGIGWLTVFFTPAEPVVTLSDFESDKTVVVVASEFVILGKVEPLGSTIAVNGTDVEVGEDGTFTYTVTLNEGVNVIRILADNNGVPSETVRRVTRELTPEEKAAKEAEAKRRAEEAAKRRAEAEAAEKRRAAEEKAATKKSALKGVSYSNLVKRNDDYVGEVVYFRGKVTQTTDAGTDRYTLRAYITKGDYGIWDNDIWIDYEGGRLLEDEIIDLWGRVSGLKNYTTVLGASRTIPWITSLYIESIE
ncbi:MAG TPA: hypothetical protein ENI09_00675 [candidate division WWE3 bacterium]|uniref:Uncharacterized protein n=1 Tax=candidate division WWE3 bacterium TaxID=2053526 RepID=A0A7C1S9R7_UNCKA|nr:hypothetical protein [candidate division WWE3 bacterium]